VTGAGEESIRHDEAVASVTNAARKKLCEAVDSIQLEATEKLREMYVGKRVKCECFDALVDGDDYFLEEEVLDIQVFRDYSADIYFHVMITLPYKSLFANKDAGPKPRTFYLRKITEVQEGGS